MIKLVIIIAITALLLLSGIQLKQVDNNSNNNVIAGWPHVKLITGWPDVKLIAGVPDVRLVTA